MGKVVVFREFYSIAEVSLISLIRRCPGLRTKLGYLRGIWSLHPYGVATP